MGKKNNMAREIYYEQCQKTGSFIKRISSSGLPGGRYIFCEGKTVRVGDAKARPDEPWCNKTLDWDNGITNPVDGKKYGSKRKYLDSLKRQGCTVSGYDSKVSNKREIKGDFDVRKDLTAATRQVLSKPGRVR